MVGRPHAVDDLRLQLRRSPGDFFGVSAPRAGNAPDPGRARPPRVRFRLGLRTDGARRRDDCRSRHAQDRDHRRPACLERHLPPHSPLAELPAPVLLPRRGGPGRDVLLSRVDVSAQRLPRPGDPLTRDGPASDERLRRNDRRRFFCRPDRPVPTAGGFHSSSLAAWVSCSALRCTGCSSSRAAARPRSQISPPLPRRRSSL